MPNRPLFRTVAAASILLAAISFAVIFYYRISIIRYTAEKFIRNALPDYVSIDDISFDLKTGKVRLGGFRILNPSGFPSRYLLEIGQVTCRYRMKTKNILDGIEIFEPIFNKGVLYVERRADGVLNIQEMPGVISRAHARAIQSSGPPTVKEAREEAKARGAAVGQAVAMGNRKISDIVKLPNTYMIKSGRFVFSDDLVLPGRKYNLTIDDISATLVVDMNESYTQVRAVSTTGQGSVNADNRRTLQWHVVFNPNASRLTMSNRFDVSNISLKTLEPYYDRYSPIIFRSGDFSGNLIFDFDNGNIGSTNEIRLSNISFSIKPGAENQTFWGSTVPALAKYFTTATGDVVFDFKIKGDMRSPQFYFGPITKRALTYMVVDKITDAVAAASAAQAGGSQPIRTGDPKADAVVNALKMLMEKKK